MVTITAVAVRWRSAAGSRRAARNTAGPPSTTIRSAAARAASSPSALPPLRYSASNVERSAPTQPPSAPRSAKRRPATAAASPPPNCTTRNPANKDIAPPADASVTKAGGSVNLRRRSSTEVSDADFLFRTGIERDGDPYRAARDRRAVRAAPPVVQEQGATALGLSGGQPRGQSASAGDRRHGANRGRGDALLPR